MAEDVEAAPQHRGIAYGKQPCQYELVFPDSEENRLKILRFLCADHLAKMPVGELLELFDPLERDGAIVIRTHSQHFVVRGQ